MSNGLDDVVAAHTVLSDVDGRAGQLIIRGHSLDELAAGFRFEDLVSLLFDGFFDALPADIGPLLGAARVEAFEQVKALDATLLARPAIEGVRALMARLPDGDDLSTALRLVAAPAVFTPAIARAKAGKAPIAPDPALNHAVDILRMLRGEGPSAAEATALNTYLVAVSDHGLNASTFAARVVASTLAGLGSAAVAGISALKGPLHGGAPGPVIEMLDEIGEPANARAWIEAALDRGERLMGFGHRIYKVRDPRADALKAAVRRLDKEQGRLAFAEEVERSVLAILRSRKPDRSLETNVEFYTALLLEALDFPPESFTCVFAMGRTAGWMAHAKEQVAGGRIIRPQSVYIGPKPKKAA